MQVSKANGSGSSGSNNGDNGSGDHGSNDTKNGSSSKNGSSNGAKGDSGSSHTNGHTNGSGTSGVKGNGSNGESYSTTVNGNSHSSYDAKPKSTTSATTGGSVEDAGADQKESSGASNTTTSSATPAESSQRHTGTVKWFNVHMGWGWITRDDPPESDKVELFVHIDDIEAKCEEYKGKLMMGLRDGESVEFSIAAGRKPGQLKAVKVTGPGGNRVIGQSLRGQKRPFAEATEKVYRR